MPSIVVIFLTSLNNKFAALVGDSSVISSDLTKIYQFSQLFDYKNSENNTCARLPERFC